MNGFMENRIDNLPRVNRIHHPCIQFCRRWFQNDWTGKQLLLQRARALQQAHRQAVNPVLRGFSPDNLVVHDKADSPASSFRLGHKKTQSWQIGSLHYKKVTSLRIYLTGYMGAGKSTIGRQLAAKLNYRFVDTDREIIKGFGKSISRIFSEDGEAAFRQAEVDLLEDLSGQNEVVVSTGGGTLTRPETMEIAKDTGTLIYLFAPVEVLYERVIFSYKDRPMLNVPNSEAVFQERFSQRETFYRQADLVIETHQKTTAQVVEEIHAKLISLKELE